MFCAFACQCKVWRGLIRLTTAFFGTGQRSRSLHCGITHKQSRQEWILFEGPREDTWRSYMLIKKHLEAVGSFYTAACSLLCPRWIPLEFSQHEFFFSSGNPTHRDRALSLSKSFSRESNMSESLDQWKEQLWEPLHNVAVSHVSCYSVRQLKFTSNACFNLLPCWPGFQDKWLVLFTERVKQHKSLFSIFY